ncbi:MAG: hypothetical protein QM820_09090 [Minicystis sp.]
MSPREPQAPALPDTETIERVLPSGRSLVLKVGGDGEEIEIRGAGGDLDLRIILTDAGPVVSLRGARVEVDSADVAVRCRNFDVEATGSVRVASNQEVRIEADEVRTETKRDIHLNGAFIRLNCTTDGEAEAQALLAQMAASAEAPGAAPATGAPCACAPAAPDLPAAGEP